MESSTTRFSDSNISKNGNESGYLTELEVVKLSDSKDDIRNTYSIEELEKLLFQDENFGEIENIEPVDKCKKYRWKIDKKKHTNCCMKPPEKINYEGSPFWPENPSLAPNKLGVYGTCYVKQGLRSNLEDRHQLGYGGGKKGGLRAYLGVFDGHSGEVSAHYCSQKLFSIINEKQTLALRGQNDPTLIDQSSNVKFEEELKVKNEGADAWRHLSHVADKIEFSEVLRSSFVELENQILFKSKKIGFRDGTTAVVVCVVGNRIYCANIGDSRAVLSRNGIPFPLSYDHKPHFEMERKRIEENGGFVRKEKRKRKCCCFSWEYFGKSERVYPGGFTVSRTLGDYKYKVSKKTENIIIADCDITSTNITSKDEFIVIGSDGFWDKFSNEEAVKFVRTELKKYDPDYVADEMCKKAFLKGSDDNITVGLLFFTHHPKQGWN